MDGQVSGEIEHDCHEKVDDDLCVDPRGEAGAEEPDLMSGASSVCVATWVRNHPRPASAGLRRSSTLSSE